MGMSLENTGYATPWIPEGATSLGVVHNGIAEDEERHRARSVDKEDATVARRPGVYLQSHELLDILRVAGGNLDAAKSAADWIREELRKNND